MAKSIAKRRKKKAESKDRFTQDRRARAEGFLDQLSHDRSLWFMLYFAVVLAYLLLNQGGSIDLERHPVWAFRAFAFGGLILFSILDAKRIRDGFSRLNLRGVLPISVVILLIASNIVSIRPFETVEETMNILAYASLAFLCYTYIYDLKRLRQFLEIILVAGFLIAIFGLYIFYGALWGRGETTPLSSLFYWHNPCAGFLLLIWPVMLAQFYSLRKGWPTFLILYIFYFTFTAFALTLSRGGWLAGFLPFFFIPFILSRKTIMVSWRPILLVVLYFISATPLIIRFHGRFLQPILDRWNQMRWDDYSVIGRFEFWDIAWKVFLKHPWVGIGFNTFGYYYVHYQSNPQYYTKDPHSLYLRFLVEGGIIGAVVIIAILVIVAKLVFRTLKVPKDKMLTVYRVGLLAGIVGEFLHMGIDFDWTFPVIPMLLLCQIAIVQRTFTYPKVEQELTIAEWEPGSVSDVDDGAGDELEKKEARRGWFIPHTAVWATIAGILFAVNIMGYVSMHKFDRGKFLIDNQGILAESRAEEQMGQLQREAFRGATQEIPSITQLHAEARSDIMIEAMNLWVGSLKYNPWNWYPLKELVAAHYYWSKSIIEADLGLDLEEVLVPGLGYGERLLKVTPHRPASYFYVGQIRIIAGRHRGDPALAEMGVQNVLHSVELDPINIPRYYFGIAQHYFEIGDNETSLEYLETLEEIFVPLYEDGNIDFGALRGKSLARQDWIDITETCRDAWWLKAELLLQSDRTDEALEALYNGFNAPLGGGEWLESQQNLGLRQLPFAMRIASIAAEREDWNTTYLRAGRAVDILVENDLLGTPESREAHRLYQLAGDKLDEAGEAIPEEEESDVQEIDGQ